ncbi:Gamma-aminobutyric acid type B receptor subunit 2 [Holothuria leucospilota]|uniref:Gamma-aminobutyric acid type B receptor subunit 2 n=1 Tax=Holothuria leucospilota TaxID=206669 RepID=A0A9Q1HFV9_HOLLE|nr:Gamma-aminobutyric acid type B receptor subunit 2 [Holothuria leucospilota]
MCSSGDGILPLLLLFVDKIVLLLVGSFLSYEIRQASLMSFGDSRQVIITIYNIIIFGACGLILMLLLESAPTSLYIFTSALVIFCTSISMATMFLPKVCGMTPFSQFKRTYK